MFFVVEWMNFVYLMNFVFCLCVYLFRGRLTLKLWQQLWRRISWKVNKNWQGREGVNFNKNWLTSSINNLNNFISMFTLLPLMVWWVSAIVELHMHTQSRYFYWYFLKLTTSYNILRKRCLKTKTLRFSQKPSKVRIRFESYRCHIRLVFF